MALTASEPVSLKATGAVARRQAVSRASRWVLLAGTLLGVSVLVFLAYDTVRNGWDVLSWDFLTSYPSRRAVSGSRAASTSARLRQRDPAGSIGASQRP